jgi:nucleotide-binding universal stress UspA family protein
MLKDVVVNLSSGHPQDFAADYAISVAAAFEAHVVGVAFVYEPVIPGDGLGAVSADLIEVQRQENTRAANEAIARFEAAAKAAGVLYETRLLDASVAGAADLFGRLTRRFDISVVGQAHPDGAAAEDLLIEGALFESGRPVIIVPYIQYQRLALERVLVCWDASRPATRAIADSLPFLQRAKLVEVLVVTGERGRSRELAGTNMSRHLARHGINVELKRISSGEVDVQSAILSHIADSGAEFMVMGGYGHSRLREFILGGVTRGILKSMTVPVLMSH